MAEIHTIEEAKAAAVKITEIQKKHNEENKSQVAKLLEQASRDLDNGNSVEQHELAALLTLPEEQFSILGPVFLEEFRKNLHGVNEGLLAAQLMNATGLTLDNVEEKIETINKVIDTNMHDILSFQKRDFLKELIGVSYNILAETEGIAKKKILIPIEYCHADAKMPTYGTSGAAGLDLYASADVTIQPNERMLIPTGVAMEIPEGHFCYVMGRSGNTIKKGLHVALGLVDEDYRGEIGVMAFNQSDEVISFAKGDRVAQMVILPYPKVEFVEADELSDTERGTGGYGSTGK
jgi:dUTP pyrophosphatase